MIWDMWTQNVILREKKLKNCDWGEFMADLDDKCYDVLASVIIVSMRLIIDPFVNLSKPMNMGEKMKMKKLWELI